MTKSAIQIKQHYGVPAELAAALFHELRVETKRAEAKKASHVKGMRADQQRRKAGVVG